MSIAASLVVKFGAGADSSALVIREFDEVMNVDAAGNEKSSFSPGNEIFFRVLHEDSVRVDSVNASLGMIVPQGEVIRDRIDAIDFDQLDKKELSVIPVAGSIVPVWFNNELTGMKRIGKREVFFTAGTLPATADIKYKAKFSLYKLITPKFDLEPNATFRVLISIYMEAA